MTIAWYQIEDDVLHPQNANLQKAIKIIGKVMINHRVLGNAILGQGQVFIYVGLP